MNDIRRHLPASGIRDIFDRAVALEKSGETVLHLEIGRPEWPSIDGAIGAVKQALDDDKVHYITNRGLMTLREAIADDIAATTTMRFDPATEIIVTLGASEAVSMCALALLGSGDEAIIPQPAWNHYEAVVTMAGAKPVCLPLSPSDGFMLDPERVAAATTPRTRMLIVNSPSNPTGAVQPDRCLEAIARLALDHGFFVVTDEVYKDFVYEGGHQSIARHLRDSEQLIYVNSLSKSDAMTGWRVGYVAARPKISDALNRIHQYLTVCGSPFAQEGAAFALRHPRRRQYLDDMKAAFAERRQIWRDALAQCEGATLPDAAGAFYLFPRIDHHGMSAREFSLHVLENHQIAVVPGDVFGEDFSGHIRISYGGDLETQRTAAARMREVLVV